MRACVRVLCGAAAAAAAVFAQSNVDELRGEIERLNQRIAAQESQLQDLKTAQKELLNKLEAAPVAAIAPAPAEKRDWLTDHVKVGGYGSMRFETNDAPGEASGFTFRRFVLTTDVHLSNRVQVYTETEFERFFALETAKSVGRAGGGLTFAQGMEGNNGGEISLEQAWGQYNFAERHGLRAGIVLTPLGRFNLLHDDDYWDLPRRTLVDRDAPVLPVDTAWRELGAGLVGSFALGSTAKLDYQAYVLNGATLSANQQVVTQTSPGRVTTENEFELSSGAFDGSRSARALAWRAAFSPSLPLEVALSGYHGRYTPSYLGVKEPVNAFGLDYKWRKGAFEFEGEGIYSTFGKVRRVAEALAASAGDAELELEGLSRTRYGFWADFKYNWRPAWLKRTFLGKPFEDPRLIPILRYERVWLNGLITDLEDYQTQNFQQDRISLGVSYRPVRPFALQFAYEHNRRLKGETLIFPGLPLNSSNGFLTGMVFGF